MHKLMSQQMPAGCGLRSVSPMIEDDVIPKGVCGSARGPSRGCRRTIGVYSYPAEVAAKSGFEKAAGRGRQRLSTSRRVGNRGGALTMTLIEQQTGADGLLVDHRRLRT
jgi:hypothetical protein